MLFGARRRPPAVVDLRRSGLILATSWSPNGSKPKKMQAAIVTDTEPTECAIRELEK